MASPLSEFKVNTLAPGAGSSMDTPEGQAYQEAITQSMKALEDRMTPQSNLYNIAAGFLKPTRGGSFGESLGNVNEVMGAAQERQEKEAIPIAQARAALAGQSYQMSLESKSQQALAKAVGGMSQEDLAQTMSSPQGAIGNPQLLQRLANAQMSAVPGTKAYEQIKGMIDTQNKLVETGLKMGTLTDAQVNTFYRTGYGNPPGQVAQPVAQVQQPSQGQQPAQPAVEGISQNPLLQLIAGGESGLKNVPNAAGTSSAFGPYQITEGTFNTVKKGIPELQDKTFEDFKKDVGGIQTPVAEALLAKNQDLLKSSKIPLSPLNQYSVWFSGDTKLASADPKTPVDKVMSEDAIKANNLQGKTVGDVMNQLRGNLARGLESAPSQPTQQTTQSGLSPENIARDILATKEYTRQQISEAEKAREAPAADSLKELATIKEGDLADNRGVFKTATRILNDPKMNDAVGLLFKNPGVGAGLATMARDGVKVGPFGLSVDVYDGLVKDLPSETQAKLRQLDMSLSQIFVQKAQAMKSAFGPQISNADIVKEEKTMASIRDPLSVIKGFILRENTRNDHRMDLSRAYHDYISNTSGTSERPYKFLSSKGYRKINDDYNTRYDDISNIISNSVQ